MSRVLITGGTGLIGSEVAAYLKTKGYGIKILTRQATDESKGLYHWDIKNGNLDPKVWIDTEYIINLAGSSIIGGRWTPSRKKKLRDSRIASTKLLVDQLNEHKVPLKHFIQISAMGYYGDNGNIVLTEESPAGSDFMAQLCVDWENASDHLLQGKKSILRVALYLSKNGGVYTKLGQLAKFYLATAFGSGKMYASYTHQTEFAQLIEGILNNTISPSIYNAVGYEPFQMNDFIRAIANNEQRSIVLPNIPAILLKWVLGEASATLLNSYRVTSPKLEKHNFFQYQTLQEALKSL